MADSKSEIMARIKDQLPFPADFNELSEDSALADLGLTSLHLLSMLLALRQYYELNPDLMAKLRPEMTLRDFVTLIHDGISNESEIVA